MCQEIKWKVYGIKKKKTWNQKKGRQGLKKHFKEIVGKEKEGKKNDFKDYGEFEEIQPTYALSLKRFCCQKVMRPLVVL